MQLTTLLRRFRYKDAVNECTAALEAQPNYHKALTRRSKAYEHMGLYKQALSDVQKSNKAGEATPESLVSASSCHCACFCLQLPALVCASPCKKPGAGPTVDIYHVASWRQASLISVSHLRERLLLVQKSTD